MFKSSKPEIVSIDYQEAEHEIMEGKKEYHRQLEVFFFVVKLSLFLSFCLHFRNMR